MRQTNNALTHLTAQYRAVFKNALVTGSAVFSAFAALYVPNAQAADVNNEPTAKASDTSGEITGTTNWTVDSAGQIFDNRDQVVTNPGQVHVSGSKLIISSKDGAVHDLHLDNGVDIYNRGDLNVTNVNIRSNAGTVSAKDASFNLDNAMVIGQDVSITEGSDITVTGKAGNKLADYAQIGSDGSAVVNNSSVNLGEAAQFRAEKDLTVNNSGSIVLAGTSTGSSIVRANSGSLNVQGDSLIDVSDGKAGSIAANSANFNNGAIKVGAGSTLLLEGSIDTTSDTTKADAVAGKASGFKNGTYNFSSGSNINISSVGNLLIGGSVDTASEPSDPSAPPASTAANATKGLVVTFNDNSSVDVGNGAKLLVNNDSLVNFKGSSALNMLNGSNVTISNGADLVFAENSKVNNNGGAINVESGGSLKLGANNVSGSDYIDTLDRDHVNIKNLGTLNNKGTVTITNGWVEANNVSDFGIDTKNPTSGGKVRLENGSMISVNGDLNASTDNFSGANAVFENGSTNGVAPYVAAKNVTFVTAAPAAGGGGNTSGGTVSATDSTGGIKLVGQNLTFQQGPSDSTGGGTGNGNNNNNNSGTQVTINGQTYNALALNGTSSSDLSFTAERALAVTGLDAIKLTNAELNLDRVTVTDPTGNASSVNTNLAISTGANLNVKDFDWTAKDLLVEGQGQVLVDGSNTSFTANNIDVKTSTADAKQAARAESTTIAVNNGAELAAKKFNVEDGSFIKVDGSSTLSVKGDGDNATVDIAGGNNITINGGTLNLNDIQDTVGAKFNLGTQASDSTAATPGKFEVNSAYKAVGVQNGSTIKVDLTNVLAAVTPPADTNPPATDDGTNGGAQDDGSTNDQVKVEQLTLAELNSLKEALVNGNGILSVTGAEVDLGIDSNGNLDFKNLAGSSNTAIVSIETEQSKQATVTNVGSTDELSGGWKAVQAKGNAASIGATSNQTLALYGSVGTGNNIIENESGGIVGVELKSGAALNLTGGNGTEHNIGAITGSSGTLNVVAGNVAIKEMDGNRLANVDVQRFSTSNNGGPATVVTAKDVSANVFDTRNSQVAANNIKISNGGNFYTNGGSLEANNIDVTAANGNFYDNITGVADLQFNGKNNYGAVVDGTAVKANNFKGTNVALAGGANMNVGDRFDVENLTIVGDSTLDVGAIRLQYTNNEIRVGDTELELTSKGDRNGHIIARKTIDLNGGTLVIDPDYNSKTSTVFTPSFDPYNAAGTTQGTTLSGNIIVGQNAALGIGDNEKSFRSALARYQNNGTLNSDRYGAYAYIDKDSIALNDKKLVVGTESLNDLRDILTNSNSAVYLGKASALEVTAKAMYNANQNQVFSDFGDKTLSSNGGTIIVPSTFDGDVGGDITKIFGKAANLDTSKVSASNPIYVTTANGLYIGEITNQAQLQGLEEIKFVVNPNAGDVFAGMSHPMKEFYYKLEEAKGYDTKDAFNNALATDPNNAYGANGVAFVRSEAGYQFFSDATAIDQGRPNEKAARLAVLGGAAQATQLVNELGVEAAQMRMGGYNSAPDTISYAYQGYNLPQREVRTPGQVEGSNIWVNPTYRKFSSDHVHANQLSYGTDVDLYGAALGFDFTSQSKFLAGAYVNFGRVDGTGKELGAGVTNEGNYIGGGAYVGFSPANHLDFMFDVGYNRVSNDLKAALNSSTWDDLTASTNSSLFSAGFKARYGVELGGFEVEPFGGLRVNHLSMDSYDVKSGNDTIVKNSQDALTYVSIPLGVGVKRSFEHNGWEFSPELNLNLTTVLGNLDQKTNTEFTGIYGAGVHTESEVLERVTYGAKLGFGVAKDNTSVGLEVGYVGSSKSSDVGVSARAAVKF